MMSLSVHATITNYHRLGSLNNKFLTFLVAGESKIKARVVSVSGEDPPPGS